MRDHWSDVRLLRNTRKEVGITQEELSKRSGVPQPVISRIEGGKIADPSYNTVSKIFQALRNYQTLSHDTQAHSMRKPVASDLMNSSVVSVRPTDRVKDAWLKMRKNNFSQLPVIDDRGRIAGGITESSLPSEDMENVMEKRVQELMADAFPIVGKDTRLATLVALLKTESAVLVVDKGKLAGIVTRYDLMENAYRRNRSVLK